MIAAMAQTDYNFTTIDTLPDTVDVLISAAVMPDWQCPHCSRKQAASTWCSNVVTVSVEDGRTVGTISGS
jgi:hypothetical protein